MSGSLPPGMMWNPVWVSGTSGQVDPNATSAVYTVPDAPMFIPDPNYGANGGPMDNTVTGPPPGPALDFSDDGGGGGGGGLDGGAPSGSNPFSYGADQSGDDLDFGDDEQDDESDPRQRGSRGQGGHGAPPQRGGQPQQSHPMPMSGGNRLGDSMGGNPQDAGGYGNLFGGGQQQPDPALTINPLGTYKAGSGSGAGYGGLGAADNFWGASYGGADYEEPSLKWPGAMPTDSFLQPFQAYFKQLPTFY